MDNNSIFTFFLENLFLIVFGIYIIAIIYRYIPKKKTEKQIILDELKNLVHKVFIFSMMGRTKGSLKTLEIFYNKNKSHFSFDIENSYKKIVSFYTQDEYYSRVKPSNAKEIQSMKDIYNKMNNELLKSIQAVYNDKL